MIPHAAVPGTGASMDSGRAFESAIRYNAIVTSGLDPVDRSRFPNSRPLPLPGASMPVTTARDDFLSDCDAADKAAYEKLFDDLEGLAKQLEDSDPSDAEALGTPLESAPLRLRIDFEDRKSVV